MFFVRCIDDHACEHMIWVSFVLLRQSMVCSAMSRLHSLLGGGKAVQEHKFTAYLQNIQNPYSIFTFYM